MGPLLYLQYSSPICKLNQTISLDIYHSNMIRKSMLYFLVLFLSTFTSINADTIPKMKEELSRSIKQFETHKKKYINESVKIQSQQRLGARQNNSQAWSDFQQRTAGNIALMKRQLHTLQKQSAELKKNAPKSDKEAQKLISTVDQITQKFLTEKEAPLTSKKTLINT